MHFPRSFPRGTSTTPAVQQAFAIQDQHAEHTLPRVAAFFKASVVWVVDIVIILPNFLGVVLLSLWLSLQLFFVVSKTFF